MAVIKKDGNFMGLPMNIKRGNPIPLDDSEIYYSLSEAQEYAQNGATSYVGQIIVVVNEAEATATPYVITNTLGVLSELGSGTGSAMIFVNTVSALTVVGTPPTGVPDNLEVGQQAFVSEDQKIHFLTDVGANAPSSYVWRVQASDAPTWNDSQGLVTFYVTDSTGYSGVTSKSDNTLYFLTDVGKIYKGSTDVTSSIEVVDSFGDASSAHSGKIYVGPAPSGDTAGYEFRVVSSGSWVVINPGYYTDGANWASADSSKFATIGLIKKGIQEAVSAISLTTTFTNSTGTVQVGSGTGAVLTGVAHDPTYVADQLKLTIPVYGGEDIVVDIPKDKFVTAGQYYEDYPNAEAATHHKVIVLTIDNQETPVIIPAESLVNIYTANNEGKNVVVSVADNKISASVTIDPVEGNALTYSESGFKVDISGKVGTYGAGTASEIIISDAEGNTVSRSGVTVLGDAEGAASLGTSTTEVPVASVIARAITTAVSAAQTALQQAIDGKMSKLAGSPTDAGKIAVVNDAGTEITIGTVTISDLATVSQVNNKVDKVAGAQGSVVVFGSDSAIADSSKTIGGSALSSSPSENTLATELAVHTAIENSAVVWTTLE